MSTLKYWLWLANLPNLRNQIRLSLLETFGTPEDIYCADQDEILLTPGMSWDQAKVIENKDLATADRILADCQSMGLRILTMQDADYPNRLKNIYDPPCLLYLKGKLPVLDEEVAVAVVGTRSSTPYGIQCAENLGYELANAGAVVVTGLARGIDSASARGCLRAGGVTVGVLGNGIDVIYPPENQRLYEDVAATGVLVSEYPPGTGALGKHFPVRNRIISGLSLATLVVEAPVKSGALITAGTALEQGRDVYAVPGPIDAEMSQGCNRLIQEGAGLVCCGWDILRDYADRYPDKLKEERGRQELPKTPGYQAREVEKTPPRKVPESLSLSKEGAELSDDQVIILKALPEEPTLVDDIVEATQLPARRVLSALTMLELGGYVLQSSGKRYARNVELTE